MVMEVVIRTCGKCIHIVTHQETKTRGIVVIIHPDIFHQAVK